jgi:hypothetical protein
MNPPAHSRSYKMAKWQLGRRRQKPSTSIALSITLSLVCSLIWFAMAFWAETTLNRTLCVIAGTMWFYGAYLEWLLKGYREIIEEQAKLLEDARAKQIAEPTAGTCRA